MQQLQTYSQVAEIVSQRGRLREQIRQVKRQIESEKRYFMEQLRHTNSREKRERLMIKF